MVQWRTEPPCIVCGCRPSITFHRLGDGKKTEPYSFQCLDWLAVAPIHFLHLRLELLLHVLTVRKPANSSSLPRKANWAGNKARLPMLFANLPVLERITLWSSRLDFPSTQLRDRLRYQESSARSTLCLFLIYGSSLPETMFVSPVHHNANQASSA